MAPTTLARILNRWDLICLFLGSVIGSGIFLVPNQVIRHVDHSVGLALGAWLTGGVLALAGALTFGELAAAAPAVGGPYVFLRDGFGRPAAFLYGWVAFIAGCGASIATLGAAFSATLAALVQGTISLTPLAQKLLTYFVFATAGFDVLVAACVFHYRRRRSPADRPYRVPGYPWTPLAFILATVTILGNLMVTKPRDALVGLGILGLGLPAYWIWHARQDRKAALAPTSGTPR